MTAPFCLPAFGCAAHCDQVSCRPRQGKLWELRLFGAVLGVSEEKHKGGIPTRKPIMGLQSWTCVDLRGPAGTFGGPSCTFVDLRGPSGHLRGPSWTFVDLRGPSWTLVDLRGPSWTFVHLRGPSWLGLKPSWGCVGFKRGFVDLRANSAQTRGP